jgi:hypothetical protein
MTSSVSDEARARRAERGIARATLGSQRVTYDPAGVAPFVAYLSSDFAGGVNGQFFYVYGNSIAAMSQPRLERTIVREQGIFSVEELVELMPSELVKDAVNPAPVKVIDG